MVDEKVGDEDGENSVELEEKLVVRFGLLSAGPRFWMAAWYLGGLDSVKRRKVNEEKYGKD